MRKFASTALLISLVTSSTPGQSGLLPGPMQEDVAAGFDHIYSLEYDHAEQIFRRMIREHPNHPAGYAYLAGNIWLRELNGKKELELENFTSAAHFMRKPEKPLSPSVDRAFREATRGTMERATELLESNPKDKAALYYLGVAHGNIAAFDATVNRDVWSAFRNGSKSFGYHKKVLELDPHHYDAYLTVGLYNYVAGSIPWTVKWLAFLIGYRGSKKKGIEQLELVSEKGQFARDDARVLLLVLYAREKRLDRTLQLLEELHARYPKNYLLALDLAAVRELQGQRQESVELYQEILRKIEKKLPHYDQLGAEQVYYRLGTLYRSRGDYGESVRAFQAALRVPGADENVTTLVHLNLGRTYDLMNDRDQAMEQYRLVLDRKDFHDSHDAARHSLSNPYRKPS